MAATAVKRPPKVDVDLMFLLGQASHALETEMTAKLQALGVSPRAHCVLAHALRGELTQSQVAEQCALDKTTMVVTMDELERAGLAERRPSSSDRRARIIAVTEAGERIVAGGRRDRRRDLRRGAGRAARRRSATRSWPGSRSWRAVASRRRPSASARCAVARCARRSRSVRDRPEQNYLLRSYLVFTNQETNR